jgi:methionyl aminopeptidase
VKSKRRSKKPAKRRRGAPVGSQQGFVQRTGPIPKTPDEIDAIAASGAILAAVHDALEQEAAPGVSTKALDELAETMIREAGGTPAFLGYPGPPGAPAFPGSICASVNDEVVHGIPGEYELQDGDLIAIDVGVVLDGWVSDAARTHGVGKIDDESARLSRITSEALDAGIAACRAGGTVGDIGAAVQPVVENAGYSVIRSLVGHGVGRSMHEEPQVPNFGVAGSGPKLVPGLVIAVEPMVNAGGNAIQLDDDRWTVRTKDGTRSAHWEHTVAVTDDGPRILTAGSR